MPDHLALGRSVVIDPGADPPGPWASCERVRVHALERVVADDLGAAWRERRPLVIELEPGLGLDDPRRPPAESITGVAPWEWSVDLDLVGERLHHGMWSNALDARAGAGRIDWHWVKAAERLGARRAPGDDGDVVLADGRLAVLDGGPLEASVLSLAGVAVVHRISLEHASLHPLGSGSTSAVLAPDQLAAVTEARAGSRVIAPAGAGKTRVLTERARLLLEGWGLPPGALALVAYNVRAAAEMAERLGDLPGVRVRTLNALGRRLCGRSRTLEEPDVRRLLAELVAFPRRAETDPAAPWLAALGRVRLGLADPAEVEEEFPDVSDLERVARAYRRRLAEEGAADFDEQVTGAIERLLADPSFRHQSQRFARVLLVDEFQDLTPAHLLLIRLLAGPAGTVFGVGDDDQTIYGYAGASPRWLVDFATWFPHTGSHALEVNYRCPGPVVAAAANLLTRNTLRVPKEIRPGPARDEQASPGPGLVVLTGADGPANRSAARVRALIDAGAPPRDIAVLARVNASLAPVQVMLVQAGVATTGGVDARFLQRSGVRAALAWLAVATAPSKALPGAAMREAARRPRRGLSASLLDLLAKQHSREALDRLAAWLDAKSNAREADKVREFGADVDLVRAAAARGSAGSSPGGSTAAVLDAVRGGVGGGGLDASANALDAWSHGAIAAHGDDLDALGELAALEPDASRFADWLSGALTGARDAVVSAGGDGANAVTLASVHAVKGREWAHVVVHHVSEGLLPHRLAPDLEEERRVFHVALTRCRRTVAIVPGEPPSPFLLELEAPGEPAADPRVLRAARGAPPRTALGAGTRSTAVTRRPSPAGVGQRGADETARDAPDAPALPASPGMTFTRRGHRYEVLEVRADGVLARIGEGPATTAVAFGTPVTADGRVVILAHPLVEVAFAQLRSWRSARAKVLNKPAFVVCGDRTLSLIAAMLPTNEAALLRVGGIGPVKLETYGDELLAIAERLRSRDATSPGAGAPPR